MIGVDPQTVDDAGVETVVEAAIGPVMNALADAGHSVTEDEVGAFLLDMLHDLVVRDHECCMSTRPGYRRVVDASGAWGVASGWCRMGRHHWEHRRHP